MVRELTNVTQAGWIIAFVSSVIADINDDFPNFCWWSLVYMLGLIIGVIITVATNSIATYHVAIVGFLAAGLVFTTSSVNSLIYYPDGAKEAGAAGFILLSMVAVSIHHSRSTKRPANVYPQIVWIFYYGSQPQATHRQTIDSFALHKDHAPSRRTSRHMTQQSYRPETQHSTTQPAQPVPQMYNSAQLAGFEDLLPSSRLPRRPRRRDETRERLRFPSTRVAAAARATAKSGPDGRCATNGRNNCCRDRGRATASAGVPLPREGDLQLRGEPGRRE